MNFKISPLFFIVLFLTASTVNAQFPGCPTIDVGSDVLLDCSTPCVDLTATPFHVGATSTYTAQSIPHTPPIAYNEAGGTPVSVGTDDEWSPIINLPFTFCYFGQNYTTCKVGSNGALQLGPAAGGGAHPWAFTDNVPSPNLIDAGHIFGPYHDIDPSVAGQVNYYILGTAPCRIFVISYYDLGHFSCTSLRSTHMTVLYETTNAIDVYVLEKETCGGWNSGNTVIGIQNPTGTAGIAAPGRNTGAWTVTTPEGWRFLPDGAPIYSVEWFEGGNLIANGNTVNVCPSNETTYTARATYTSCDGTIITEEDEVIVTPANTDLVVTEVDNTPSSCGGSDGEIEITASGGTPGYTYSSDNVVYQGSGVFGGLAAGNHTFFAMDAAGCISALQVVINENSTLEATFSLAQSPICNSESNGQISISPAGGSAPYTYSMNGGAPVSTEDFSGLTTGTYTFDIIDDLGCTVTIDTFLINPPVLDISEVSTTPATCDILGQLEVNAVGGVSPYQFSIDAGATTQSSATFTGLNSGTYMVYVIDDNTCSDSIEVTISGTSVPDISIVSEDTICSTASDGQVEVSTINGTAPYSYTINGINPQPTGIIGNLSPGSHLIEVTDFSGCTDTITVNVYVFPSPTIFDDTIACYYNHFVTGTTSYAGGVWSAADTAITFLPSTNVENPTIATSTAGTYTVTYTDNACNTELTAEIYFYEYPWTWLEDTLICEGVTLLVNAPNENPDETQYIWSDGQSGPNVSFTEEGYYEVTLTNACHTSTTGFTLQYQNCFVNPPNVISLSPGSQNSLWYVDVNGIKEFEVVITNRWGNVVFDCKDQVGLCTWDGRSPEGNFVEEGTYFYLINAVTEVGEEIQKHGFIQVVN